MEKGEGAGRQQPLATRAGRVRGQSGRPQLGATRGYAHPWQRQRWPRQGKAAVGRCGKRAAGDASAVAHAASRDATRRDLRREGGARPGPGTRALRTAEWRALLAVLPPWLLVVAGDSKGGASTATIKVSSSCVCTYWFQVLANRDANDSSSRYFFFGRRVLCL